MGWFRDRWLEGKWTPVFQPHAPIHLDTSVGIHPVGFLKGRGTGMNFGERARNQEAAGLAEVHTLTELQHAEIGEGPWKLYIYGKNGFHTGGVWFRRGPMKYPDEEITAEEAKSRADSAIADGREVRVCDGGDELVFHSQNGATLYPDDGLDFWKTVRHERT
jgi:hypothetical protein